MSVHVTSWVLKHSNAEGTERAVLLVLADHAHPDGTNAICSINRIRLEARRKSERAVHNALRELEKAGRIIKHKHGGVKTPSGWTNRYTVVMDERLEERLVEDWVKEIREQLGTAARGAQSAPLGTDEGAHLATARGASPDPRGAYSGNQGVHPDAPEPTATTELQPSEEPTPAARARVSVPPEFEQLVGHLQRFADGKGAKLRIEAAVADSRAFLAKRPAWDIRQLTDEADEFADYWLHGGGENVQRRDGNATWKNRLRSLPNSPGRGQPGRRATGSSPTNLYRDRSRTAFADARKALRWAHRELGDFDEETQYAAVPILRQLEAEGAAITREAVLERLESTSDATGDHHGERRSAA